ncbi:hypothetical protein JET18_14875 [Chryseobacterium sp. L7]|uniref:Uncharacterized protein n=1 Tax=Chryseobacterium endalhagicum TaxID=2797638 RepID=A0ABS1QJQ4_9FLAO|nr:hypothetical protein [Chryseobacterium endalhagicum]MBL1222133.1 hypothetical protein [Chryseobacterium endalhagicum]
METLEEDFNCSVEAFIISLEKSGEIDDLNNKEHLTEYEMRVKKYINDRSMKYAFTDPIKDSKFSTDRANFISLLPGIQSPLSVNFNMFETLVTDHLGAGYVDMKISFMELPSLEITKILEAAPQESEALASREGHLYAVVSFIADASSDLLDATYAVFNVSQPYHIPSANLNTYCINFQASALGIRIRNASTSNYVPCCQKYDLRKVKKYTDRIRQYLGGCKEKTVENIDFELCFGERKHVTRGTIQSFYLASIPSDNTKAQLTAHFPYYDQGSLEP